MLRSVLLTKDLTLISDVTWHEGEEHIDFSNKKDKLKLLLERCINKVLVADVSAINSIWMHFSDGFFIRFKCKKLF
ncbi:unnamed protein product [Meloidogyne enterolobii]|uniref:Uncharacterized protein n=1 Tax=Meloidogyne enterolobii TaxID=390850 RepID=A0ACB1ACH0_MELEN